MSALILFIQGAPDDIITQKRGETEDPVLR